VNQAVLGMIGSVASGIPKPEPSREPSDRGRGEWFVPALLAALVLAIVTVRVTREYRPLTYLVGDCPYYAATAASLIEDHDLDLRNSFRGARGARTADRPRARRCLVPEASSPDARSRPCRWSSSSAFRARFCSTFSSLARSRWCCNGWRAPWRPLGRRSRLVPPDLRNLSSALRLQFLPDLFATLVLTSAWLALQRGRDRQGGLLLGLAATAKLTHLFLLPFGFAYAAWCRRGRGLARTAASAAAPLAALALLNAALFGSPFVTSYDRNVILEHGSPMLVSHRGLFDGSPLRGLEGELFDPIHGLLADVADAPPGAAGVPNLVETPPARGCLVHRRR